MSKGNTAQDVWLKQWFPFRGIPNLEPQSLPRSPENSLTRIRELVWWVPGVRFLPTTSRLVVDVVLEPEKGLSRLVIRMSGDAAGVMAQPALVVFRFIDTIMARRQLLEIRRRVESYGARSANPSTPETGRRDQYQLYEVVYACGETAGVAGKEQARRWRRAAIDAGILEAAANELTEGN